MKAEKEITYRKVADLHPLPNNPRKIKKEEMERLVDSITINGFWEHRPLALTEREGRLIVLCGNQRLKAARKLKINELPTILYRDLSKDEENELILRDNKENGEWDFDALKIDDAFKDVDFDFIGIEIPKEKVSQLKEVEDISNQGNEAEGSDVENNSEEEKENFYRSMFKDVLYESDNDFEIPNLLKEMQAAKLQIQERLVREIVDILSDALKSKYPPLGVALVMEGEHLCKSMRGAKKKGKMKSSYLVGAFKDDAPLRNEFFNLIK